MHEDTLSKAAGRRFIIKRPRLTSMLDEANARIICLVAPAGYGKTTLAREWLELGDRRSAWYAGGPASADVAALAAGLARAMATILPGSDRRLIERLGASAQPQEEAELLAELLAEDVTEWPDDAWLFVDDYHFTMEAEPAERFFEVLTRNAPVQVVLASRQRPTWATARRILYSEIYELGKPALSFTREEANAVLSLAKPLNASDLIQVADGWPAIVGLAALNQDSAVPQEGLPDALYEYFAEELFQRADQPLQLAVCQLSLVPSLTKEIAASLLRADARTALERAAELGFLAPERDGLFSMHPLLRTFLQQKLSVQDQPFRSGAVRETGRVLVSNGQWDAAFALAKSFGVPELLKDVLESALEPLLYQGRLATLAGWLEYAREHGCDYAVVDLGEAELALRRSRYLSAEGLGKRAARRFRAEPRLAARSWIVAARGAHLSSRDDVALRYLSRAERAAAPAPVPQDALWLKFLACLDLERRDVTLVFRRLQSIQATGADNDVRLAVAEASLASRTGRLERGVRTVLSARELLPLVSDPMLRSTFLNRTAYVLAMTARYKESVATAERCLADAVTYRLDFAVPHVWTTLATGQMGMRHFARAEALLEEAISAGTDGGDVYVIYNARAAKARSLLAQGRVAEAIDATLPDPGTLATRAARGEYLAARALALACASRQAEAERVAQTAGQITKSIEATGLLVWVRAICEAATPSKGDAQLLDVAVAHVARTGFLDAFVCAYRAYPRLLDALLKSEIGTNLVNTLLPATDEQLARQWGLSGARLVGAAGTLSPRERDVFSLLAQGLSNRQIAQALFISESTAKVHVRHIFEKIGVRSRTEAALRWVRDSSLQEPTRQ